MVPECFGVLLWIDMLFHLIVLSSSACLSEQRVNRNRVAYHPSYIQIKLDYGTTSGSQVYKRLPTKSRDTNRVVIDALPSTKAYLTTARGANDECALLYLSQITEKYYRFML